mmetsp:Transcript_10998/g.1706  ORF Transcript_10998/g.1706 Transcript_10998/m.1706 type:complete len:84 (-) Transcript_10998:70-321(-)
MNKELLIMEELIYLEKYLKSPFTHFSKITCPLRPPKAFKLFRLLTLSLVLLNLKLTKVCSLFLENDKKKLKKIDTYFNYSHIN